MANATFTNIDTQETLNRLRITANMKYDGETYKVAFTKIFKRGGNHVTHFWSLNSDGNETSFPSNPKQRLMRQLASDAGFNFGN